MKNFHIFIYSKERVGFLEITIKNLSLKGTGSEKLYLGKLDL
jgi:hypothetical protein